MCLQCVNVQTAQGTQLYSFLYVPNWATEFKTGQPQFQKWAKSHITQSVDGLSGKRLHPFFHVGLHGNRLHPSLIDSGDSGDSHVTQGQHGSTLDIVSLEHRHNHKYSSHPALYVHTYMYMYMYMYIVLLP